MVDLLDGKKAAQLADQEFSQRINDLKLMGITPGLAVILIGNDSASQVYVRNKKRRAQKVGINYQLFHLAENITQTAVLQLINKLNHDPEIDGIMVQMPVPPQIDAAKVMNAIAVDKDVDGFSFDNIGRLWSNNSGNFPATPRGIIRLLQQYEISVAQKHVVVVGRSNIVGRPMAGLLLNADATVTMAHSKTPNLAALTKQADILIVAIGQAEFITADYVKPQSVVIDVGMNHDVTGKLVGDVDFSSVSQVASMLTPVPGGVGPMTITGLLEQVIILAEKRA
ncbi:bifunctional 5,10-methylenetetrahydrofolate dehydrogenase/5,10-methenyltetrahydrofolate cyclohydrolase [Bombilactobacillus thymidiniphilus]|uniref:Bifunctional protein FolD n=1 Tax=Bombilactobacillus thymidiniphilus TaxID=2923363 RepID=A0ABY4PEZ2_9LACO|nr:tetrahydrofolate dehydrogenase/cyclohydrolase catalytic domain-containing protein [Bombilactobacillus thymidiniphilus]UQS84378.1 bifunctional methylenetetrahydrofolate dehydrogenase/methenyltetrahydrofolate cyclohydrolase [Bombilactobacillus thymidiniphilus]